MFCVECGEKLEDRMKFCPRCGTKVEQLAPAKEDNNNSNGNTITAEKPKTVKQNNGAVETVSAFQEGEYYRYRFRNTSATIQIQEILQGTKKERARVQKGSMARQLHPNTKPIDQRFERSKSMKDYYQNMVSNGYIVEQTGSELAEVQKEFIFEGSLSALATMLSGESIAPVNAWKLVKDGGTVQTIVPEKKKETVTSASKEIEKPVVRKTPETQTESQTKQFTEEMAIKEILMWMNAWLEGLMRGDKRKGLQIYENYIRKNCSKEEYNQYLVQSKKENSNLSFETLMKKYCSSTTAEELIEKVGELRKFWLDSNRTEEYGCRWIWEDFLWENMNENLFPKAELFMGKYYISLFDLSIYIKGFQEMGQSGINLAKKLYIKWKIYDYLYGDGRTLLKENSSVMVSAEEKKVLEKKHSYFWNLSNQWHQDDHWDYDKHSNSSHFKIYIQEYKGDLYYMKAEGGKSYGSDKAATMTIYKQNIKSGKNTIIARYPIKSKVNYCERDLMNAMSYRLFVIRNDIIYYVNNQQINRMSLDGQELGAVEEITEKVLEAPVVLNEGIAFLSGRGALMFFDSRTGMTEKVGQCNEIIAINESEIYYMTGKNDTIMIFSSEDKITRKLTERYTSIKKWEKNIIFVDAETEIVYYLEPDNKDSKQILSEEQQTLIESNIVGVDCLGNEVDRWRSPKVLTLYGQLFNNLSKGGYNSLSFNGNFLTCKFADFGRYSKRYDYYKDDSGEVETFKKRRARKGEDYVFLSFTRSGEVRFIITKNSSMKRCGKFLIMTQRAAVIFADTMQVEEGKFALSSIPLSTQGVLLRNGELKCLENGIF